MKISTLRPNGERKNDPKFGVKDWLRNMFEELEISEPFRHTHNWALGFSNTHYWI